MMREKIIAVDKDANGDIAQVLTHTGRILSIEQAIREARSGNFDSIDAIDKEGHWYIGSSTGDGQPERGGNLDILPSIAVALQQGNTTTDPYTDHRGNGLEGPN